MKKYVILIIIAVVLAYLFFPSGDDTREIEAVFIKAMEAGEKKDLDGVMEPFSINYRDEYGATYPVVKNVLKNFFDKFDDFKGNFSALTVSINETEGEKQAVANLDVYVLGMKFGIPTSILGDADSPQNLTITLKKSGLGVWKIIKVEGLDQEF
ncbi:MAG: hypothetical protein HYW01_02600 [Deltaproteobacteria bacterium]|nr:hypothetical protein [Deltaproteobacteria bacterium]